VANPSPGSTEDASRPAGPDGLCCARCRRPLRIPNKKPAPPDPRGRVWAAIRRWPEGWICSGCFAKACETYGICDSCGTDRLLPGIGPTGQRWCADCAGGIGNFTCTRCGQEGWQHYQGVCGRCVLADRLSHALDDGTGHIRRELRPLHDLIVGMARPRSGILWLSKPHVPPILRALAHHQVPLTHQGIATLTPWRSVIHVRDLLVAAGILPPVDRFLFLFEQWLPGWLDSVRDGEHRKVLHHYVTWHLLRRLRATASAGPIGHYRHQGARRDLRVTAGFLTDLAQRDLTPAGCRQADLDQWMAHATAPDKTSLRPFLRWTIKARRMPHLQLPPTNRPLPCPISHQQRLELIRRLHSDDSLDPTERVIGLLILLYAQSLTRITRLTIDDITIADGQMLIRLGNPSAPVPAPFDQIIRNYLATRPNLTTATNRGSRWLFPGRRAGQPMHPTTIRSRLQRLGIPNLNGRSRALREMLLQAPPAVVAGMLGYAAGRAEAIAAEAGATWQYYAAGDHSRQPHRART
jgi:hypothetical protein